MDEINENRVKSLVGLSFVVSKCTKNEQSARLQGREQYHPFFLWIQNKRRAKSIHCQTSRFMLLTTAIGGLGKVR